MRAWQSAAVFCGILGWHYLAPASVEHDAAFTVGSTRIQFVELLIPGLLLFHRRVANPRLFRWGGVCLAYASISALFLARDVEIGIGSALWTYGPLLVAACIPFGDRYRTPLRWALTALLFAIVAETLLFATGVLSYSVVKSGAFGDMDRISTTVGAATSTGTVVFMLGVWVVDLWGLNWRGLVIAWVALIGIAATFSRGPLAMAGMVALLASFKWARAAPTPGGATRRTFGLAAAIALSIAAVTVGGPVRGLADALVERLESGAGDTGRLYRYEEAWSTFQANPIFGVGSGHYHLRPRYEESGFAPTGRTSPHNVYLLVLAENGILGTVLFVGGFLLSVRPLLARLSARPLAIAVFIVGFVGMNVEVLYSEPQYGLLFAGMFAWFGRSDAAPTASSELARR
jgi:O-antigen ligase